MIPILAYTAATYAHQVARFAFSGPMSSLMAEGKQPGVSTSGESFNINITDGGGKIQPTEFDIKIPGSEKSVKVSFTNAKFANGHLQADVQVQDGLDKAIEGVRLDIKGASETYKATDGTLKEKSQTASIASPLFFGDMGSGETSKGLSLDVSTLTFHPDTTQLTVNASLSGLSYISTLHFGNDSSDGGELDVNSKGQIFSNDLSGARIVKMESDGSHSTTVVKMADQAKGMALNPLNGDIAGNCANNYKLYIYSSAGDDKATIQGDDLIPGWPSLQRFDLKGRLWSTCGANIVCYSSDGKILEQISKIGDYDLDEGTPFDLAPDGSLVVVSQKTLFKLNSDHKSVKRVAQNGTEELGQLMDPAGCRVDSAGNIYVTELGDNTPANPARVSEFDKNGNLVRVFGRGAMEPKDGYPDAHWDGEVVTPADIAFGPDGKVYISFAGGNGAVMVFQPF